MIISKKNKEIIKRITQLRKNQKEEIINSLINPLTKIIQSEQLVLTGQISLRDYHNQQIAFSRYFKELWKR